MWHEWLCWQCLGKIDKLRIPSDYRFYFHSPSRSHDPCNLIKVLPLSEKNDEANNRDHCCVEIEELTPELGVFWITLIEFFHSDTSYADHLERILPDLPTICENVARSVLLDLLLKFREKIRSFYRCSHQSHTKLVDDKLSSQCIFLSLIEMLQMLDLSDQTGRESVKNTIVYLLVQSNCDENLTKSLITICEKLYPTSNSRLQLYVEIVRNILHPIDLDESLSSCKLDSNTETEVSSLVAKLVELRDAQARLLDTTKECGKRSALEEKIGLVKEQLLFSITPFLPNATVSSLQFICLPFAAVSNIASVWIEIQLERRQ